MNRPRILVLAIALAFSSVSAFSTGIESKGQPVKDLPSLGNYGMGVSARTGIKSIVPSGWKVYVHQSAKLPETLDWSLTDTWLKALERLAANNDLSILVDWDSKSVMVRTPEVALQEGVTRQEIGQAALTPLPKFSAPSKVGESITSQPEVTASAVPVVPIEAPATGAQVVAVAAPVPVPVPVTSSSGTLETAPVKPASISATPEAPRVDVAAVAVASAVSEVVEPVAIAVLPLPVIRTNPTPAMVSAQQVSFAQSPVLKLSSTVEYSYSEAVAYNKPTAKRVATAIASKYNLRVVWALADDYPLRGPVTLLADNAGQDLELLYKALGRGVPISLELSEEDGVIRAYKRGSARPIVVPAMAGGSSAGAPGNPGHMDYPSSVSGGAGSGTPLRLDISAKQPLEDALNQFAKDLGYSFEWQVTGGFEANSAKSYEGATVAQTLIQVLPQLGLSADVYTRDKLIVVRPGEARN